MTEQQHITGHGGGKSDDGGIAFIRQPDTISSHATARMTLVMAAGPIEGLADGAASIRFDGVPLLAADGKTENYEGVAWQATTGTADQPPIGLEGFNAVESTTRVQQRLRHQVAVTRQGQGDAARVTLRFPRGLVRQNEAGIFGTAVSIRVERRRPDGSWLKVRTLDIAEKQTAAFDMQVLIPLEPVAEGQSRPAIRLIRLTPLSTESSLRDDVDLMAITWLRWEKLNYPGVSTLGLRFDATSFSGRIPRLSVDLKGRLVRVPVNYNPHNRRSAGLWNGAFKSTWSNNPAWVLLDLLTDTDWGLGLGDHLIETYDLHTIAAYCDEKVSDGRVGMEPRFLFDGVISRRRPAVQVIGEVCAAMRVHYFWSGGRLRFIQDRPGEPVMVLTNALVEEGAFVYTGPTLAAGFSHAMVSYTDPESDTGVSVETETDPRFFAAHGYKAREVAVLGCRRRSQTRRHARWLIETASAHLHAVSWHASLDHFAENPVRPGDIIRICDQDRIGSGSAPGRIIRRDGTAVVAALDGLGGIDAPQAVFDYETVSSGWQEGLAVTLRPSVEDQVIITPPQGGWPKEPRPGGACLLRRDATAPKGQDYRVIYLREVDRHRLEVSAIRHDPGLYDRVDSGFSLDDAPRDDRPAFAEALPKATGLVLDQPKRLPHGGDGRDLHAGWQAPSDPRVAFWRLEGYGPEGESRMGEVPKPPLILRDLAVGEWRFRLRSVDWSGRRGPAMEAVFAIKADASTAELPTSQAITPGYSQIIITWDRGNLPPDALVEVLEYPSRRATTPSVVTPSQGAVHILAGRNPGQNGYFKLRTRLRGGTLSAPGEWLVAAAEAIPQPEIDVITPVMVSAAITGSRWSGAAARTALGRNPVAGDLVTLYREVTSPWAETRRFDGTAWGRPGTLLSGDLIAPATVSASRLKVDPDQMEAATGADLLRIKSVSADLISSGAMQSADYHKGKSGFRIDTSGSAEFNNAQVRGLLEGSTIKGSLLVASTLTIPTEAAGRFLTLEKPRPLRYSRRHVSGSTLIIGPMQVGRDGATRHIGDQYQNIVAADDPHGDQDDGENRYFSRFWSLQPRLKLTLTHRPTGLPWGQHITRGHFTITMKTASGRVLAESLKMDLSTRSSWRSSRSPAIASWLLPLSKGFAAGAFVTLSREVRHEGRGQNRHYTSLLKLTATLTCRFSAADSAAEDHAHVNNGLVVEIFTDFGANSLSQRPVEGFYRTIDLEGTTHD